MSTELRGKTINAIIFDDDADYSKGYLGWPKDILLDQEECELIERIYSFNESNKNFIVDGLTQTAVETHQYPEVSSWVTSVPDLIRTILDRLQQGGIAQIKVSISDE